jgi:hypothetical protein
VTQDSDELIALLRQAKPFIDRAANPGAPHAQDKRDAEILLPRVREALAKHPEPHSVVSSDGLTVNYVPLTKDAYVERISRWLIPADFSEQARASSNLDGVYTGTSRRIMSLVRLAYFRGVRRGVGLAWEAKQPVLPRGSRTT